MKNIFIYIFLVLLCLVGVLRVSAENSIDNLVTSIGPSVFELSCNIDDEKMETSDMITLDKEKFITLFSEEIKNNKAFYHGDIYIEFYFYNINTLKVCGGDVSCSGVQIRLTMKAIYMFNKVKEYRYEVKMNQY